MKTKKELKEEYNAIKPRIGVFQILNKANGKVFIDSSINLDKIWNRYRVELNFGSHRNIQLQREWKEFGAESFSYEILSELKQTDNQSIDYTREANLLADMFIAEKQPFGDNGYN